MHKSICKSLLHLDYFDIENNHEKNCLDNSNNIFDEISDKMKYILICNNCYKSPKIAFSGLMPNFESNVVILFHLGFIQP